MRTFYAPLFFFGFIAAALSLAASPLWLLPLLAGAVLLSFTCERLIPTRLPGIERKARAGATFAMH